MENNPEDQLKLTADLFLEFLNKVSKTDVTSNVLITCLLGFIFQEFRYQRMSPTEQLDMIKQVGALFWSREGQTISTSVN